MKTKLIIPVIAAGFLTACAETPVKKTEEQKVIHEPQKVQYIPDQRPSMSTLSMTGPLSYNYKIYGDPVAAPVQVFADSGHMYLQLAKNQIPPIPITRDGKVIEYEVKRGFMVIPKVSSVVLRLGPRKAFIDEKNLEIVSYNPLHRTVSSSGILNVQVSSPKEHEPKKSEPKKKASVKNQIDRFEFPLQKIIEAQTHSDLSLPSEQKGKWRICTYPSATPFKAGIKLQLQLAKAGWSVKVDTKCRAPKDKIVLEKL